MVVGIGIRAERNLHIPGRDDIGIDIDLNMVSADSIRLGIAC